MESKIVSDINLLLQNIDQNLNGADRQPDSLVSKKTFFPSGRLQYEKIYTNTNKLILLRCLYNAQSHYAQEDQFDKTGSVIYRREFDKTGRFKRGIKFDPNNQNKIEYELTYDKECHALLIKKFKANRDFDFYINDNNQKTYQGYAFPPLDKIFRDQKPSEYMQKYRDMKHHITDIESFSFGTIYTQQTSKTLWLQFSGDKNALFKLSTPTQELADINATNFKID